MGRASFGRGMVTATDVPEPSESIFIWHESAILADKSVFMLAQSDSFFYDLQAGTIACCGLPSGRL